MAIDSKRVFLIGNIISIYRRRDDILPPLFASNPFYYFLWKDSPNSLSPSLSIWQLFYVEIKHDFLPSLFLAILVFAGSSFIPLAERKRFHFRCTPNLLGKGNDLALNHSWSTFLLCTCLHKALRPSLWDAQMKSGIQFKHCCCRRRSCCYSPWLDV